MPPTIMYHAAPKDERESIMANGIDHRIHFGDAPKPRNTRDVTYAPRGNYLDESAASLLLDYPPAQYDYWEVNVEGLRLYEDAAWFKGWYCRAKIAPARIRRLTKKELPAKPK